ncbi:MAG: Nuclear envelope morphology protein 1 [Phylliscum demangeonii]|nr:MAG: Nuclear envelope morphology protein 1 [Phylliscum demangeonii]
MNSLNILSARIIRPPSPSSPASAAELAKTRSSSTDLRRPGARREGRKNGGGRGSREPSRHGVRRDDDAREEMGRLDEGGVSITAVDEKTPLLADTTETKFEVKRSSGWKLVPRRIAAALIASIKWVLSKIAAPGVYIVACVYDDEGRFSPLLPARRLARVFVRRKESKAPVPTTSGSSPSSERDVPASKPSLDKRIRPHRLKSLPFADSAPRPLTPSVIVSAIDEAQGEDLQREGVGDGAEEARPPSQVSRTSSSSDEGAAPLRRSIRIKAHHAETEQRRRTRQMDSSGSKNAETSTASSPPSSDARLPLTASTLKSPTSPASSLGLTRYPRAPAPPRPLIPRRQPSYSLSSPRSSGPSLKTLILDLDETLIHSLAKGGRMSTGHMVEVKLNASVGLGGGGVGPQHPILYYVHKRPHCDDFLRKVCKWYKLVIFTASVQEYADPVIDWLEQDRKYFSGRYYRQHCTFRGGNYIKDISCVEPDLSQVMIVDNSPASYAFHEDNGIPIEGWISDPTDNDLLHLIPLLEGLQYVTDVRALLALRMGEAMTLSMPMPTPTAAAAAAVAAAAPPLRGKMA